MRRLLVLLACLWLGAVPPLFAAEGGAYSGITGRFRLTEVDGGRTVTQASTAGSWRLVFFGYTHCPVVCPTGLRTLALTLQDLGPKAKAWRCLFITLDPERDDPRTVRDYVRRFDPRIIGLDGGPAAVRAAMRSFHLEAERVGSGKDYAFDHPAIFYVLAPDGSCRAVESSYEDPGVLAGKLEALMGR